MMESANVTDPSACFRNRIVRNPIDQAHAKSLRGAYFFSHCEHFEGTRFADQSRQPLRSSPACDEPEGSAAVSEDRAGRGNAAMAGKRKIESSTHAMAHDGGDHGRGIRDD